MWCGSLTRGHRSGNVLLTNLKLAVGEIIVDAVAPAGVETADVALGNAVTNNDFDLGVVACRTVEQTTRRLNTCNHVQLIWWISVHKLAKFNYVHHISSLTSTYICSCLHTHVAVGVVHEHVAGNFCTWNTDLFAGNINLIQVREKNHFKQNVVPSIVLVGDFFSASVQITHMTRSFPVSSVTMLLQVRPPTSRQATNVYLCVQLYVHFCF